MPESSYPEKNPKSWRALRPGVLTGLAGAACLGFLGVWTGIGTQAWGTLPQFGRLTQTSAQAQSPVSTLTSAPDASKATSPSQGMEPGSLAERGVFAALAARAIPSVVNILTYQEVRRNYGWPYPGFPFFGGGLGESGNSGPGFPPPGAPSGPHGSPRVGQRGMSLGSGFVVKSEAGKVWILTNEHVIAGADEIQVQFTEANDEKPTQAKVLGRDPELDVALLEARTSRAIPAIPMGDSDDAVVGEYLMAVGNPFGQGHSVTHGILSQKNRVLPENSFTRYLQTDAPINPGNSGGPLVNLRGEVIGINNAIDARAQGIGFAIPINAVKSILPILEQGSRVSRGYIGVAVEPLQGQMARYLGLTQDQVGVMVVQVTPNSPASRAGLKPYDVIVKAKQENIHSHADLLRAVSSAPVGSEISLEVLREGKKLPLSVEVAERK